MPNIMRYVDMCENVANCHSLWWKFIEINATAPMISLLKHGSGRSMRKPKGIFKDPKEAMGSSTWRTP